MSLIAQEKTAHPITLPHGFDKKKDTLGIREKFLRQCHILAVQAEVLPVVTPVKPDYIEVSSGAALPPNQLLLQEVLIGLRKAVQGTRLVFAQDRGEAFDGNLIPRPGVDSAEEQPPHFGTLRRP
jgi:hypothetical protein